MPDLDPVFERLAAMLREHAEGLVATRDDADQLYLETSQDPAEFFGAVMRKKAQVAYHLMPVYRDPGLLADLGPALRKRMQGKSCFNFTRIDDDLFPPRPSVAGSPARSKRLAKSSRAIR